MSDATATANATPATLSATQVQKDTPAAAASPAAPAAAATTNGEDAAGEKEDAKEEGSQLPASLYVGELSPSVSEAILFEIFSGIGPVTSIRVCRDAVSHESLGYAYVNFNSGKDAKKAIDDLNYADINGRPCRIMWSQRDPSMRKSGKGNVFIKNLDPSIDNKALHDTFGEFGEILSAKVVTNHKGESLGFGFVHFATAEAADDAIETVNGMSMNGRPVYVAHHKPRSERESQAEAQRAKFTNVYVKNLAESVDDDKLNEMFSKFGTITSAVLSKDSEGKSKGFGFVNFETHDSAQKAVDELNETDIDGKKLYVGRAQNKYERQNELKKHYEQQRLELLQKYQGVNLYIKNLEDSVDSDKLRDVFAPFGKITSARVMTDVQGKSRGFGFVCYSTPDEANKAISEMNQHILGSKPLYVALAQRKDVRHNQMRQQLTARNHLRLQQQAAAAGGIPPQLVGAPLLYPGQAGFAGGPGVRVPYPAQPQVMLPRGVPAPLGQWQQPPKDQGARFPPGGVPPAGGAPQKEPLEQLVAKLPVEQQKQVIGEELYPKILAQPGIDQELAGKITGMLLDMDNSDLFALSKDDALLKEQVQEAHRAYQAFIESQAEEN